MDQYAILSAIGADRPGLVDEVSRFIFERGGNIEDSRMVNLRGQFAMMVLIGGSPKVIDKIRNELPDLSERSGLHAEIRLTDSIPNEAAAGAGAGAGKGADPATTHYRLTATAMDQAGLVHRVSHLLREINVNIESLDTRLAYAPVTGAPMFDMELLLSVSRETPLSLLREQLGKLCSELNIDWELVAI